MDVGDSELKCTGSRCVKGAPYSPTIYFMRPVFNALYYRQCLDAASLVLTIEQAVRPLWHLAGLVLTIEQAVKESWVVLVYA